jgi:hypothetical protein
MITPPSADRIEQVALGFMASKVLFTALELGLFTQLAKGPLEAEEVRRRCGLHPRSVHPPRFFRMLLQHILGPLRGRV